MRPGRFPLIYLLVALGGCSGPFIRSQSPEAEIEMPTAKLVGDFAVPYGMHPIKVESIALVTRLPGTGSDPEPGASRELLSEMKAYGVNHPRRSLVRNGILGPGAGIPAARHPRGGPLRRTGAHSQSQRHDEFAWRLADANANVRNGRAQRNAP